MFTITTTTMNICKVVAVSTALLCVAVLVGCVGQIGDPAEEASPLGCHKSKGRYFDPKVGNCVQVYDKHTANVLNAYRYANKLVESKVPGPLEYDIYPRTFMTVEQAEAVWADLRGHGATMISLGGNLPDNREYDAQPGMESEGLKQYIGTPKSWGKRGVAAGCGWTKRDNLPPTISSVEGMLEEGLKSDEKERPRPQLRQAIFTDHDCRIRYMNVSADPKVMLDWWNHHLDLIEGVQPIVNDLDRVMPELGPMAALEEGK